MSALSSISTSQVSATIMLRSEAFDLRCVEGGDHRSGMHCGEAGPIFQTST